MNLYNSNNRALIIGAGSGGDIATALLIIQPLLEKNISVDLAGFLTPWSLHTFNGKLERPINQLFNDKAKKFIYTKENQELPFFESKLFEINKKKHLGIDNIYLFSLQYGIKKLTKELQILVDKNKYDLIIVVDVGGDILARKSDYKHVITPIVDFSCLEIFKKIKTNAKQMLAVVAPGVDGELGKEALREILEEYEKNKQILATTTINKHNTDYLFFLKAYTELCNVGFSAYTAKIITKTADKKIKQNEKYKKLLKVNNASWSVDYIVNFDFELISKIFYLELHHIQVLPGINYESVARAYKFFKKFNFGGTEVDLSYVPTKIQQGKCVGVNFVSNIMYRASEQQKQEVFQYVDENINKGEQINLLK